MTRYQYPHSIDNGLGESLTFLRRSTGPNGERLEVEGITRPGQGPPMHIHHYQTESLTVAQGRMGYQRPGQPEQFAEAGTTVTFKPGEAHRFWNAGTDELKCTGYIEPADNFEFFISELFASMKQSGGKRPDPFVGAFLTTKYRHEFSMLEIPAPVQKFVFPVQVAIGSLLGKYRKYADAPAPIRR